MPAMYSLVMKSLGAAVRTSNPTPPASPSASHIARRVAHREVPGS
jgi:hypothetical protein